jgi:tRNA threonylcarbamoyladenosine biosynthesis protein TsaB
MKILSLETSTESASIALLDGDVLIERDVAGTTHSATLLPAISALLADGGISLRGLDLIAFGAGPGAFTGLRLACGVAQGLAMGARLPVLAVGSLEALASQCARENVFVAVDARLSEVYFAAYRRKIGPDGETLEEVIAPACGLPASLRLPEDGQWFGCGSAFEVYGDVLLPTLGPRLSAVDPLARPRAASVARLAAARSLGGDGGDPVLAAPLYIRDKVAMTTAERIARGGKA